MEAMIGAMPNKSSPYRDVPVKLVSRVPQGTVSFFPGGGEVS